MDDPLRTSPDPDPEDGLPDDGPTPGPVGVAGSMRGEDGGVDLPPPRLCVDDLRRTFLQQHAP